MIQRPQPIFAPDGSITKPSSGGGMSVMDFSGVFGGKKEGEEDLDKDSLNKLLDSLVGGEPSSPAADDTGSLLNDMFKFFGFGGGE